MEIEKVPAAGILGSFNHLDLLVQEAPYAVAVLDREMRYQMVNQRWLNDYGLVGKDIIGQSHFAMLPDMPDSWKVPLQAALAGETLGDTQDNGAGQQIVWKLFPWYQTNEPAPAGVVVMTNNISYAKSVVAEHEAETLRQIQVARHQIETIANINAALSIASTEEEILAAVAGYATGHGAASLTLSYAGEINAQGMVIANTVVANWSGNALDLSSPTLNRRMTRQEFPVISFLYSDPDHLLFIEDIATDTRLDENTRALMMQTGIKSTVLMPLYSKVVDRWQGILNINWRQPHSFTDEEKVIFMAAGQTASAIVTSRRAYLEARNLAATLEQQVAQRTEELRSNQRLMRQVIDGVPALIFAKDRDSRYTLANEGLAKIHGVAVDKLVGMDLTELGVKPNELDQFVAADRRVIDSREPIFIAEEPLTGADGVTRWMQTSKLPIINDDGTCTNLLGIAVDITELKKANQTIREANERFDISIQGAQLGIWDWNLVTNDVIFSERWCEMLGYRVDEVEPTFNGFGALLHPDDTPKTSKMIDQYLKGEIPNFSIEFRLKAKDGTWKTVLSSGKVLGYAADGTPNRLVGIHQDITERKQAEEAIREQRQFLQLVLDNIPVRVFWKDANLTYLGCNRLFAQDAGLKEPAEIVGKTDYMLGWAAQADLYRQDDRSVIDSGVARLNYEEPQTTPDGQRNWLQTNKVPLRNLSNQLIGVLGTYQDITERKNAEQAVHEANEKFDIAIQGAELGLWDWDLISNKMVFSPRLYEMLNYNGTELKQHIDGFTSLIHPDDLPRTTNTIDHYVSGELANNRLQFRMKTKDGSWKWVSSSGKAMERNADGKITRMVGILEDINDQRAAERERERLIRQLREASRYKDEFFAVMSHELRTPLNAMIGLLGIVLMKGKIAPDDANLVTRARANSDRLLTLINNILDISRMEAGRLQLTPTDVNLRRLVDRLQATMGVLAEQKQIDFLIHIDEAVPDTLRIDEDATIKVISNLLGNAFKFTDKGSVSLTITPQGNNFAVEVKDTGTGIPAHMHEIIFESFRQVDASSTRVHGGSGLGLSIVRNLCQAMGGSIRLESEPGVGSTFVAILPMKLEKVS